MKSNSVGPREISVRMDIKTDHEVGTISMKERLTCANHAEEEIALNKIGRSVFNCPKCGNDYSIGRKIVMRESTIFHQMSKNDLDFTHTRHSGECC